MIRPSERELKSCCAAFYEEPMLRVLLGDVLHPGGLRTTMRLGKRLGLGPADQVLDIACGPGRSALCLTDTFGCRVTGIDYSARSVAEAKTAASDSAAGCVNFVVGDAERLPFRDEQFDAVVIECSLCLIPDKEAAVGEMRRVLESGGRIGIADLALEQPLPPIVDEMLSWVACVAGARPTEGYRRLLQEAGFVDLGLEDASWALADIVEEVGRKLFLLDVAFGLGKLSHLPVTPAEARGWLREARRWIADGITRYVLVTARRQR